MMISQCVQRTPCPHRGQGKRDGGGGLSAPIVALHPPRACLQLSHRPPSADRGQPTETTLASTTNIPPTRASANIATTGLLSSSIGIEDVHPRRHPIPDQRTWILPSVMVENAKEISLWHNHTATFIY